VSFQRSDVLFSVGAKWQVDDTGKVNYTFRIDCDRAGCRVVW